MFLTLEAVNVWAENWIIFKLAANHDLQAASLPTWVMVDFLFLKNLEK